MKKNVWLLIAVMLFTSLLLSTFFSFALLNQPDARDREFSLMLAGRVNDLVTDEILRPLLVSRTMANDSMLIDWLNTEKSRSQDENTAAMEQYLSDLKNQFGYTAAFLVSENTHCYYTWRGLNKVLNPLNDPHDKWYPTFIKKNIPYELNADTDQVNSDHWTVFVNCLVQDPHKKVLGVCGVGMVMDRLQEMLTDYEKQYGIKINLVDSNGLVQMASDSANIQRLYLNNTRLDAADDTYSVLKTGGDYRITKYLKDLGWYLVIQTDGITVKSKFSPLVLLNLLLFVILFALSILLFKGMQRLQAKKAAVPRTEDHLTGLPNRRYFTEAYGEGGIFNTTRYKTFIIIDVDHSRAFFEQEGGSALIRMVSDIAKQLFANRSLILRWGYDTFVVLFERDAQVAAELFETLRDRVQAETGVTVSAGIAQIKFADTIKKNYYRAMQACYQAKFAGGNQSVTFREKESTNE